MSFTPITLTGSYDAPAGGGVQLQLTSTIMQPGGLIVPPVLNQSILAASTSSALSLTVFASNDPATVPENIYYQVTEQINNVGTNTYYIIVPYNAPGGTIAITQCERVIPNSLENVTVADAALGAPYGVATLDPSGNIPVSQLGNSGAVSSGVTEIVNQDGSLTFSPETGNVVGSIANPFPGPLTIDVNNTTGGLILQFGSGVPITTQAFEVYNSSALPLFTISSLGGAYTYNGPNGTRYGIFGNPLAMDGSTNPPSILFSSGMRIWQGAGLPAAVIAVGTVSVNDQYFNSTNGLWYAASVGGNPGTWGLSGASATVTAASIEGAFTAPNQIFLGTGTNTGELINLLSAMELSFSAAGQLIMGTGSATGSLLNPGPSGYVLTSNGTGSVLTWQLLSGGGNMTTTTYDPAGIGQQVLGTTATQTVSHKRYIERVLSTAAPGATPTFSTDSYDTVIYTGLAVNITSITTTGTPNIGDSLVMYFTDNGTPRTLSFSTSNFAATTVPFPPTTVAGIRLHCEFLWNEVTSKWEIVGVV